LEKKNGNSFCSKTPVRLVSHFFPIRRGSMMQYHDCVSTRCFFLDVFLSCMWLWSEFRVIVSCSECLQRKRKSRPKLLQLGRIQLNHRGEQFFSHPLSIVLTESLAWIDNISFIFVPPQWSWSFNEMACSWRRHVAFLGDSVVQSRWTEACLVSVLSSVENIWVLDRSFPYM
jgi:hypothetical protein